MAYGGCHLNVLFYSPDTETATDVDDATRGTIENIAHSTWDRRLVGKGKDARNLKHYSFKIKRITKIDNSNLLAEYYKCRIKLQEKKSLTPGHMYSSVTDIPQQLENFGKKERMSGVNECYLFHGTQEDAAACIVKEGFDKTKTDPNALYGQGNYFTEKFIKADQYADPKQDREPDGVDLTVLLCRVLLGNVFLCPKSNQIKWKRPPCLKCEEEVKKGDCTCSPENRYDSILGTGEGMMFREFVVYDDAQCYPEFIIKYTRVGRKRKRKRKKKKKKKKGMKTMIWTNAYESITISHAHDENFSPITKLNEFYQKTKTAKPVYIFVDNSGTCLCKLTDANLTAEGNNCRRKIAKRLAAEHMWKQLRSHCYIQS